jgi:hypothetical protein
VHFSLLNSTSFPFFYKLTWHLVYRPTYRIASDLIDAPFLNPPSGLML